MGYIKHNAIVVTGSMHDSHKLHKAYDKARELFGYNGVSDILQSPLNNYISFFIAPDGSKEGWDDSNEGDSKRKQLADYIDSLAYGDGSTSVQFVDVSYDEEHEAEVERTNKKRPDEDDE